MSRAESDTVEQNELIHPLKADRKNMAQWYVIRGDQERGPFDDTELKALASSGKLKDNHQIRREGSQQKYLAKNIKGLFPISFEKSETAQKSRQDANTDSNEENVHPENGAIPVQPEIRNSGQGNSSTQEAVNQQEHIWPEGLYRRANHNSSTPSQQSIPLPSSDTSDANEQLAGNDVQSKIPAVVSSLSAFAFLCWLFNVPTVTTILFWYWSVGCILLPALLYRASLSGSWWQNAGEVLLRTFIFFVGGVLGVLFIGIIVIDVFFGGLFVRLGISLDDETKKTIGFVIGSAPVAFLPRNWEILLIIASVLGVIFGKIGIQAASDGRACRRCQGTRYCYPCRGQGCQQCMFTGQCKACLGTGLGSGP